MIRILSSLSIYIISVTACAQTKNVYAFFQINSITIDKLEIYNSGLNFESDPIAYSSSIKSTNPMLVNLAADHFYLIADGYKGHLIFISNKEDSIRLNLKTLQDLKNETITKEYSFAFNMLSVKSAKFKGDLTFFDRTDTSFKTKRIDPQKNESVAFYKQNCDSTYKQSISLLNSYKSLGIISQNFDSLARIEIKSRYILQLCKILYSVPKKNLPAGFFDKIKNFDLNNSDYALKVPSYITACSVANIYYYNDYPIGDDYTNLKNEFFTAQTKFSGLIRDRLMGWIIEDDMQQKPHDADSVYKIFLSICKSPQIREEVKTKIESFKLKQSTKKPFQEMIQDIQVKDINGNKILLKNVFDSTKLVLIDCWATWCAPCLKQKPYLKPFQEKYKDVIQFVFISVDKDSLRWKNYNNNKEHREKYSYLIDSEFNNKLFQFFNIISIPHFILLNRSGSDVLKQQMPLPEYKDNFKYSIKQGIILSGNTKGFNL